jgi:signal transduction histidine kinase
MPFHTTKDGGMGMGLSISRSLIESHSGTLFFNSEFGKGCTFYFTLPI